MKKIAIIATAVLLVLSCVYLITGWVVFLVLLDHKSTIGNKTMDALLPSNNILEMFENIPADVLVKMERSQAYSAAHPPEIWTVQSSDNLKLVASYYANPNAASHRYVIYLHGHGMKGEDFTILTETFLAEGFHLLLPDARAHGRSEGQYRGMGWLDRGDLRAWTDAVIARDPQAEIMLAGISMGGDTVLMAAGDPQPAAVKCIVSDCPYTTAYDQVRAVLKDMKLNVPGMVDWVDWLVRRKAGFSLREASASDQVRKATLPLLIFHGEADDFVPFALGQQVFEAAASADKRFVGVPGATHGESAVADYDNYFATLFAFADQYMGGA
jgi:alpha-beta hydrolase superfamily lysophospholipase